MVVALSLVRGGRHNDRVTDVRDERDVIRGEQPLQVFVSSVTAGLEQSRATVASVVRERDMVPWVFEQTGAHSGGLEVSYLEQVAASDFVVWLVAGTTTAPVEKEIRRAMASAISRLLVFRLPRDHEDERTRRLMGDIQRGVKYVEVDQASLAQAVRVSLDDELARSVRGDRPLDRFVLPQANELRGRDQEGTKLLAALRGGSSAAVSGLGGVGKTALAVAVAHQLDTVGRVLFVSMRGLQDHPADPEELVGELLESFGVAADAVPDDPGARSELWRAVSARHEPVVVFDDARDEAHVRPLMPGGGRAIITSRATLTGIEAVLVRLDVLDECAAVEIIADGAGEPRVRSEGHAASELAELCGGLPLALRIVGRRLASRPAWSITDLADRLRDEVDRLDGLRAGDVAVRATFNLSYRQLDDVDAAVFRLLGLFLAGQFDSPAIGAIAGRDAEDALERLVDLGLLESLSAARFAVHDLLRIFAKERLGEEPSDARLDAQTRLAAHFAAMAYDRGQALGTQDEVTLRAALTWFDTEWPTILGLVEDLDGADRDAALGALADAVAPLAARRRRWEEWARVSRAALASAERRQEIRDEGRARQNLGIALLEQGKPVAAAEQFERTLNIARTCGDQVGQARALAQLGSSAKRAGDPEKAVQRLREAVELYRDSSDDIGEARALGDLGNALDDLGDLNGSVNAHRAALAAFEHHGDLFGVAAEFGNLGLALAQADDLAGAKQSAHDAIDVFERLDDRHMAAKVRLQLAGYLLALEEQAACEAVADEARRMFAEEGDAAGEAAATAARARARSAQGRSEQSLADHARAAELYDLSDALGDQAQHLAEYADATHEDGHLAQSHALFGRAAEIAERAELPVLKAQIAAALANLDDQRQESAAAEGRLLAEAEVANARGDNAAAAIALTALAGLHRRWGERARWRQVRNRARTFSAELSLVDREPVNVTAPDVPEDMRRRVARVVVDAIDLLEVAVDEITVKIRSPDDDRDGMESDWELTSNGIALQTWLLELPDARAWVRLAATVHGAIVSYLLHRDGVDLNTPLGETLHEIARSWTVQRRFVVEGPLDEESPMVPILEETSEGLQIARVLGAALAGNTVARNRLEQWRDSLSSPDERELTELFIRALSPIATPAEFLIAVTAMFHTATT